MRRATASRTPTDIWTIFPACDFIFGRLLGRGPEASHSVPGHLAERMDLLGTDQSLRHHQLSRPSYDLPFRSKTLMLNLALFYRASGAQPLARG